MQDVISGATHTLILTGELDMATAPPLEAVVSACAACAARLTLDLSQLTFMDSTGLNLVLSAREMCRDSGAEFALIPGPRLVQRVFEITGLVERLPFRHAVD
ncbi:MAG TPA: STAS domain-containing protein [Solirubrobacteraceae bacterium]|jgi:anti-anti-sigma factor|nr:STAS domain-containing protein [Solirubrobacteraceae bacterium]